MSFKGKSGVSVPEYDSKEGYDKYASAYDKADAAFLDSFDKKVLMRHIRDLRGKKVLDIGCGTGRSANMLKTRGAEVLWGMDLSDAMLTEAEKKKKYDVLRQWDVVEMPDADMVNTFDVVLCSLVLVHIPHRDLAVTLKHLFQCLVQSGIGYIINIPQRRSPILHAKSGESFYISSYHHADSTIKELAEEAGFSVVLEEEIKENKVHIGTLFIVKRED